MIKIVFKLPRILVKLSSVHEVAVEVLILGYFEDAVAVLKSIVPLTFVFVAVRVGKSAFSMVLAFPKRPYIRPFSESIDRGYAHLSKAFLQSILPLSFVLITAFVAKYAVSFSFTFTELAFVNVSSLEELLSANSFKVAIFEFAFVYEAFFFGDLFTFPVLEVVYEVAFILLKQGLV